MSLISTYDVRTWMGVEEGDESPNAKIALLIPAIEEFCDSWTNRRLEAARYLTDPMYCYLDGEGTRFIYAPQYPVSYVSSAHVDNEREFGASTQISADDLILYANGKIYSEGEVFTRGRRNVLLDYTAGYAPLVGGTHNTSVSTYPIPSDLRQVMIEMTVMGFKEGMSSVHTVVSGEQITKIDKFSSGSMWRKVLDKYKNFSHFLQGRAE